jgi:predicted RNA-binding Zn-ribbon protein involved in translation (DUF1610 family)
MNSNIFILVEYYNDMVDDKLRELQTKQLEINSEIMKRKIEIAKKDGQIVDSIDDLICDKHSEKTFKVIGNIPNSWVYVLGNKDKKGLNIYECEPCKKDIEILDKTKAHDCPNCGIVVGECEKLPYNSPEEDWVNLAGREGEHYHCKVCDTKLGEHYWKYS